MIQPLPLDYARRLAALLIDELAPACERIEIAGSVRRGKAEVGDLELVCIPALNAEDPDLFGDSGASSRGAALDQRLNALLTRDEQPIFKSLPDLYMAMGRPLPPGPDVRRWGTRYRRFYLWVNDTRGPLAVDLFMAVPTTFGAIWTIRTGPGDFSKALVSRLKHQTLYRQHEGALIVAATGEVVPVPEESDYFALAGLPWLEPGERTVAAIVQAGRVPTATTR